MTPLFTATRQWFAGLDSPKGLSKLHRLRSLAGWELIARFVVYWLGKGLSHIPTLQLHMRRIPKKLLVCFWTQGFLHKKEGQHINKYDIAGSMRMSRACKSKRTGINKKETGAWTGNPYKRRQNRSIIYHEHESISAQKGQETQERDMSQAKEWARSRGELKKLNSVFLLLCMQNAGRGQGRAPPPTANQERRYNRSVLHNFCECERMEHSIKGSVYIYILKEI